MFVAPKDNLFDMNLNILIDLQGRKPFQPRHTKSLAATPIGFLLIGIESNPGPGINFAMMNIRSMRNKDAILHDLIFDRKIDILALSETWIYDDALEAVKESSPLLTPLTMDDFIHVHIFQPSSV